MTSFYEPSGVSVHGLMLKRQACGSSEEIITQKWDLVPELSNINCWQVEEADQGQLYTAPLSTTVLGDDVFALGAPIKTFDLRREEEGRGERDISVCPSYNRNIY